MTTEDINQWCEFTDPATELDSPMPFMADDENSAYIAHHFRTDCTMLREIARTIGHTGAWLRSEQSLLFGLCAFTHKLNGFDRRNAF